MLDRCINADLMIATSDQLRSRTYHFSEEQERRVGSLPGVKDTDGMRVTAVTHGNDEIMVIARNMDLWFSNSPGLLEEGDARSAQQQSMQWRRLCDLAESILQKWSARR